MGRKGEVREKTTGGWWHVLAADAPLVFSSLRCACNRRRFDSFVRCTISSESIFPLKYVVRPPPVGSVAAIPTKAKSNAQKMPSQVFYNA